MTDVTSSQGWSFATVASLGEGEVGASQARVLVAISYPADYILSSQAQVFAGIRQESDVSVSQSQVFALVRGRVDNPKLRAWTFDLDSHEFYVLKLGDGKTLVYDLVTEQWSWWATRDEDHWRANVGTNWVSSGSVAFDNGSNVVVGDDVFGTLWVLNPEQGYDDSPYLTRRENGEFEVFERVATGQITTRGRVTIPTYKVYLTGSSGEPAYEGATISLSYSDDLANSFATADAPIVVEQGNYFQEFSWMSLGLISSPGRVFQIRDDGALARIDGLEVDNDGTAP